MCWNCRYRDTQYTRLLPFGLINPLNSISTMPHFITVTFYFSNCQSQCFIENRTVFFSMIVRKRNSHLWYWHTPSNRHPEKIWHSIMILLYTPHDISVFSLYHAQTFFTMLTKVMIECQWIMYARLTLFIITKITVYQTYDFLFICNIASKI